MYTFIVVQADDYFANVKRVLNKTHCLYMLFYGSFKKINKLM